MSDRLRVVVAGDYPAEEGRIVGGVQAVTHYLAEGLASREDLEVHVVTSVRGIDSVVERRSAAGAQVHLVPLSGRFASVTGSFVDLRRLREVISRLRPDVVHGQGQGALGRAALLPGHPAVLTPHGVFFKEAELATGFREKLRCVFAVRAERNVLRRARHIVMTSQYLRGVFGHLLDHAKLYYIDNAIDDAFFELLDRSEPNTVLFAGLMHPRKGVRHLVQAASILARQGAQFKLWIVGPVADRDYDAAVRQFVRDNDLSERVEFLGMVTQEELMERYSRCSILALPSFEETAPMSIGQAHAAGKPVVGTNRAGIPYMVTDGTTGYTVDWADPEGLADRLGKLFADPDLRDRMSRAAKQEAERRYRRSTVVEKHLEVYEEAIADYRGR